MPLYAPGEQSFVNLHVVLNLKIKHTHAHEIRPAREGILTP